MSNWLKQHRAGEKVLAKALNKFFTSQGKRIVTGLEDFAFSSSAVDAVFNADAEHELLLAAVSDPILTFMAIGAQDIYAQQKKSTKAFDYADYDLPQRVKDAIELAFTDLQSQDYWREIQEGTKGLVTDTILKGIEEGMPIPKLRKLLQSTFKGMGRTRAAAIARTETTLAFNNGHDLSYRSLAEEGLLAQKKWLAVVDGDTRTTHVDANGQTVGATEDFSIGGYSAPYPGAASLPAKERVNCRCTTAGVFG